MALSDDRIAQMARAGRPDPRVVLLPDGQGHPRDSARLNGMSYAIYPQGSYANKTNIAADSDVDMVIALRSAFYPDKEELSQRDSKSTQNTTRGRHHLACVSARSWSTCCDHGISCRREAMREGPLESHPPARRRADLAWTTGITRASPAFEQILHDGVQFYRPGQRNSQLPKRAHQGLRQRKARPRPGRYRPVVRIAKNARNTLIADGETGSDGGTAPSYFLESLAVECSRPVFMTATFARAYRQVVQLAAR